MAFDRGVRARTVTLDGDAFEPQGTLTGGSAAQLGVVLARLGELQAASRDLGVHEERLRVVVEKINRLSVASKKVSYVLLCVAVVVVTTVVLTTICAALLLLGVLQYIRRCNDFQEEKTRCKSQVAGDRGAKMTGS